MRYLKWLCMQMSLEFHFHYKVRPCKSQRKFLMLFCKSALKGWSLELRFFEDAPCPVFYCFIEFLWKNKQGKILSLHWYWWGNNKIEGAQILNLTSPHLFNNLNKHGIKQFPSQQISYLKVLDLLHYFFFSLGQTKWYFVMITINNTIV